MVLSGLTISGIDRVTPLFGAVGLRPAYLTKFKVVLLLWSFHMLLERHSMYEIEYTNLYSARFSIPSRSTLLTPHFHCQRSALSNERTLCIRTAVKRDPIRMPSNQLNRLVCCL